MKKIVALLLCIVMLMVSVAAFADEDISTLEGWGSAIKAKYDGTTITVAMAAHPSTEAFKTMADEFTALTGIKVEWDIVEETNLKSKELMLPWAAKSSIMWFLGSHSVDTLMWMFKSRPKRVYCVSKSGVLSKPGVLNKAGEPVEKGIDTVDEYLTTIEFENGAVAQMENGWVTPNANLCVNDIKFTILGDKGMISVDASNHNMIQKYTDNDVIVPDVIVQNKIFGQPKGFAFESIRSFVDCVASGEEFHISLRESAYGVLTILAIMESAKTRMPLEVDYGKLQGDKYGE